MKKLKSVELFLALGVATSVGMSAMPDLNAEDLTKLPATAQILAQEGLS